MTYIYIPDELNYIGEHAFDGCPIEEVTLPKSAKYYTNSFDKKTKIENLKVFISYSWESEVPFAWIDKLANDLNKKVDVILDREELGPGNSKKAFFNEIPEAHKVICVLTPEYKGKSDNGVGVLGREEYPIIKNERENERKKGIKTSKYIPLLKKGKPEESIPNELSDIIFVDFRNDEDYDESLKKLLKIFNH